MQKILSFLSLLLISYFGIVSNAYADNKQKKFTNVFSFEKILPLAFENNKDVLIAVNQNKANYLNHKASKASLYPKLDITANLAEQDDSNPNSANENFSPREYKLKLTQNLWDFNESNSKIQISSLRTKLSETNIVETKTNTILKAARAFSNYRKARSKYFLSLEFENKLKKQTGMQDYRIKQGAAISTDILQAKNALAKAITSRVIAYGIFKKSKIVFVSIFNFEPNIKSKISPIKVPLKLIPKTKDEYIDSVLKNSFEIKKAKINKQVSGISYDSAFASNFLPKFTLTGEINHKDNASGTPGFLTENIIKVEMKWPIELFGTQLDKYKASSITSDNANTRYKENLRKLKDNAESKWINFQNEKTNLEYINNQVKIAREFLKMAQLEYKEGRGKMDIVIAAQNAYYNSQIALKESLSKFALNSYSLLSNIGKLTVENLTKM